MVKRFEQTGVLTPVDVRTGGVQALQQEARSLSGLSQSFARFEEQRRQKKADEAFQAGRVAHAKGETDKKEETFFGGIEAKSFNRGLRAGYEADLSNDNREELARIERENGTDSAAYSEAVTAQRVALQQNVDPAVLPDVMERFDTYSTAGLIRVQDAQARADNARNQDSVNAQIESLGNEAAVFARNGDPESSAQRLLEASQAVENAVTAGFMSQKDGDDAFRELNREATEQSIRNEFDGIIESQGFDAAFDELDKRSKKVPGGWTPDEWDAFIADEQADINRALSRQLKQTKQTATEIKKEADFSDIEARIKGDDRVVVNEKAVDSYYQERVLPLVQNLPPEQKNTVITSFVDRTKVIPLGLRNEVSSFIRSGNPELMSEAVTLTDRLDEVPGAGEIVNTNERVFAKLAVDLSANLEPNEAVRLARQATDPKDKARVDTVNQQLKDIKDKATVYQEAAQGIFTSFWGTDPSFDAITSAKMGKEYGDLFESYRRSGADEAQAAELAKGGIQRNWGEWQNRVMKYPPATYYEVEGDSSYVMDQLVKDVKSENLFGFSVSKDNIILVPNEETARGASIGQPTYGVTVIDDNGQMIPLENMWKPDSQAEIDRIKNENVSQSKARRIKILQDQAEDMETIKALQKASKDIGFTPENVQKFLGGGE